MENKKKSDRDAFTAEKDNTLKKSAVALTILFVAALAVCGTIYMAAMHFSGTEREQISYPALSFNEIMASNKSALPAEDGGFYDWIEIYNAEDYDVDLSDIYLSRELYDYEWQFPRDTVIKSKGYLVVFCPGEKKSGMYTPFKISKLGEDTIYLKTKDGTVLDSVKVGKLETNQVFMRDGDNDGRWTVSEMFTPGFENSQNGLEAYYESLNGSSDGLIINEIMAKNRLTVADSYGDFSDWIELKNVSNEPINLSSFYITNDISKRYDNRLPDKVLQPGEKYVVFASGRGTVTDGGEAHIDFKLSEYEQTIMLINHEGKVACSVSYDELEANVSLEYDGEGYTQTLYPTPGFENTDGGRDLFAQAQDEGKTLLISEVMPKNDIYLKQNGGRYYDWLELYNASNEDINLKDYFLSKDDSNLLQYPLPDKVLKPGEYCVIMASGDSALTTSTYIHVDFKIDGQDDELYLTKADSTYADAVHVFGVRSNYSLTRIEGKHGFFYTDAPSPGRASSGQGYRRVTTEPQTTLAEGVYDGVQELEIGFSPIPGAKIYYTTDCTTPTQNSNQYDGTPIKLNSTTVIKAASYSDGALSSPVKTFSYIVNEGHSLGVISLSADPYYLWSDEHGIYADGPGWTEVFPHRGANYWKDWEISGHVSFFEEDGGFSEDCGIKIFGNWGRGLPQKSFTVKFKEKYGLSELHYPLFENYDVTCYNSFILRSGSQDQSVAKIRDEFFTSLSKAGMDSIYVQQYKPCVVYLNGEYWGIYFIREKVDENTLSQYENVTPESIDLLYNTGTVIAGSNADYKALVNYVTSHDMSDPENYAYAESKMDMVSYIDFKIAEAFSSNIDLHNIKFYRSNENDGKWRWILYDLDFAHRTLYGIVEQTLIDQYDSFSNALIQSLMRNSEFKDLYLTRMAHHLSTTFSQETVLQTLDKMVEQLDPEMERNCERWGPSYETWQKNIERIRNITTGSANQPSRASTVLKELRSTLSLSDQDMEKYFSGIEY